MSIKGGGATLFLALRSRRYSQFTCKTTNSSNLRPSCPHPLTMTDQFPFPIQLSFKGRSVPIEASISTTPDELIALAHTALGIAPADDPSSSTATCNNTTLKLLYKGKRLEPGTTAPLFSERPKKTPNIMVLATASTAVEQLNAQRSDPTIRGFDQERRQSTPDKTKQMDYWGPQTAQDKNFKFCRFQACTWQSFGHRPVDSTPHDFAALQLLQKLATDPGIVAVMRERELVVTTLGEMDPIDDRLMRQKQTQGACLLGYNTNAGQRIDVKLRTDDLRGFRSYADLASTLIHELSHNWVGEHNLLFWTNYGQMRAEYLYEHTLKNAAGFIVNGKTTAQLAGIKQASSLKTAEDVFQFVTAELKHEMAQHGLHPAMISTAIRERCQQLEEARSVTVQTTATVGGAGGDGNTATSSNDSTTRARGNPREMALAAAERRAREHQKEKEKKSGDQ